MLPLELSSICCFRFHCVASEEIAYQSKLLQHITNIEELRIIIALFIENFHCKGFPFCKRQNRIYLFCILFILSDHSQISTLKLSNINLKFCTAYIVLVLLPVKLTTKWPSLTEAPVIAHL